MPLFTECRGAVAQYVMVFVQCVMISHAVCCGICCTVVHVKLYTVLFEAVFCQVR